MSDGEEAPGQSRDKNYNMDMIFALSLVLISAIILYSTTTHVLPQTSTTFRLRPVLDTTKYTEGLDKDVFDSIEAYSASPFATKSKLHVVGAVKYSLGCYGNTEPVLANGHDEKSTWTDLSNLQMQQATITPISICTCIDDHVGIVFGNTTFQSKTTGSTGSITYKPLTMDKTVMMYLDASLASPLLTKYADQRHMYGNVPYDLTLDTQYNELTAVRKWCAQTSAPVYTMEIASVWNSKLLLLVGVWLIVVGLDLFNSRKFSKPSEQFGSKVTWFVDLIPLLWFLSEVLMFQTSTHLRSEDLVPSFFTVFTYLILVVTVLVLIIFMVWTNVVNRRKNKYDALWERIFVDVPMIVGLTLVGVALKMQNDEHDELVLLTTMFILLAGGLAQHISNVVKEVYDIVCSRFEDALLIAMQSGAQHVKSPADSGSLARTRHIMQHFGWTRLYGFFTVLLCAVLSWTISSTTSLSPNPLQFITQSQYVYFVLAYIISLAGLDLFYEALPFVTEEDVAYGVEAANRMRKYTVCVYLSFLLISQAMVENNEA